MKEVWKPASAKYEVSNFGQFRLTKSKKLMKLGTHSHGYLVFRNLGPDVSRYVHRIVLLVFVGPSELEVNHKDCDKTNNAIWNLEYVSHRANMQHGWRAGRFKNVILVNRGNRHTRRKLGWAEVCAIRREFGTGWFTKEFLGEVHGVSGTMIGAIVREEVWKRK